MTHTVTSAPDHARSPAAEGDQIPGPGPQADGTPCAGVPGSEAPAAPQVTWDDIPDGIVVVDPAGRVEIFNIAAVKITGVTVTAALGRHLTEILPLLDERGNDWWECSRASRELPRVTGQPERRLTLAYPSSERDLNVTVRYVRAEGKLTQVSLSLRDTASRERLERNRADLVSTVAHELRSPLTSVKGFTATLLAKWDRFTEEQKKLMLNTVNTDADRVTRLLAEVLDVSRIDSGRIQMRKQIVDLEHTLRRVVDGKVAAGEATHDRFVVRTEGELPEMWLDSDKIEQVLHNLVDNALRHGAGTVTIVMRGTPSGAEVTVADEGEGVPEASASRVFTKFWRGATRGNGTGLGLYIARALIEAHGGTITVGRVPGGGAEFRFVVPAGAPVFA
nr:ATP-binding protein [Frankia sp. Cppng1_Ct_nod]